jgi:hypothetical protein
MRQELSIINDIEDKSENASEHDDESSIMISETESEGS